MSIVRVLQSVESKIIDESLKVASLSLGHECIYESRAALRSVNVGTDLDG